MKKIILPITILGFIFTLSGCNKQTYSDPQRRDERIKVMNISGESSMMEGKCYKIIAEGKEYMGRFDKNGNPQLIPKLEDREVTVSLRLMNDSDCVKKGL